jgi:PAS domain S-box-containing protein
MQLMQAAAMQAQMGGTGTVPQVIMEGTKLPLAVVGQTPQFASPSDTGKTMAAQQQKQQQGVQPQFAAAPKPSPAANSMQPPLPPSQVPASKTSISIPPRKTKTMADIEPNATSPESSQPESFDDKKQLKRAANRRSAQLSRKRKKQFIEELKEENDELRRKEQILKSIPDLIVVFDSSGKIWFVSHSVSRFLDYSPRELESSSFWDRLCDDSVRLLKAAFMDALAARKNDMDTAPLGNGVWELRLVDKDGTHKIVALNGVVHFTNDTPECVCSIRPREELPPVSLQESTAMSTHRNVSLSSGDNNSSASSSFNGFVRLSIKPQQSVISRQDSCMNVKHQISDTGSCAISESGSDE